MAESSQIGPIVVGFFTKCLHIILESRITAASSASSTAKPSSMSLFNLTLSLDENAIPSIEPWSRTPTTEPMYVDIFVASEEMASTSAASGQVLERWMVNYSHVPSSSRSRSSCAADMEPPAVYKRTIILLRSVYAMARALPAHRKALRLDYRISACPEPLPRGKMQRHNFTPVETPRGKFSISVSYLPATPRAGSRAANESLYMSTSPTQIIADYVRSPAASEKSSQGDVAMSGKHGLSSAPPSPGYKNGGFGRCHSWSGALNKLILRSPSQSPLMNNASYRSSPLNSGTPPRPARCRSIDKFPSPSPSPPMRSRLLQNDNASRSVLMRAESAPVSIPPCSSARSPQNWAAENRAFLPPHTAKTRNPVRTLSGNSRPSSTNFPNSQGSRTSEFYAALQVYPGQKVGKLEREDSESLLGSKIMHSGSPQVMGSRSSSRRSYNYEIEDEDLSLPFAFHDDESDSLRSRTGSFDSRGNMSEAMETMGQCSTPRRSQNAAVGALVEMLKSAPPLCSDFQNLSDFSPNSAMISRNDSGSDQIVDDINSCSISSGPSVGKKAADALQELRNYVEMKDNLLRQSGIPEGTSRAKNVQSSKREKPKGF